ncbi:uncharacterized protein LOC127850338 isoform X2 [Dreissena polymorpha]|uniref:Spindle and kinetochore-associated protein 3 n=2 Tax=Dreissena polymorpha TaxID=45954 RepID=A0A9D4I058_DREPO|nr:uncharacterized protein LOC127850338 isoform X2 [Dreissena polymorpha]XP_052239275.1 uncharacterized protein LOC127850338 isoform X2 [Dreissena polymorpha]KAH3739374.1 hypothetical protein DPMN_046025 [Dreissena polymorpha]
MADNEDQPNFFEQLRQLSKAVERQTTSLSTEYGKTDRPFRYPIVMKHITDLKQETKELNKNTQETVARLKESSKDCDGFLLAAKDFIESQQMQLAGLEEKFSQYGYKPWVYTAPSVEDAAEDTEKQLLKTPQTTSKSSKPKEKRTPRIEDAGISQATLELLANFDKNAKLGTKTSTEDDGKKSRISSKRMYDDGDIPSAFRHNGILTTPGIYSDPKKFNDPDALCNHAVLASPVAPMYEDEDSDETTFPSISSLKFEDKPSDTPESPKLMTPGLKQFLNSMKKEEHHHGDRMDHHASKRHVNVGLFQSEVKTELKAYGNSFSAYSSGLPKSPELTYSLEALSEMTGMFRINPMPQAPTMPPSLQMTSNKENVTPTEPELLSSRIGRSKMPQENGSKKTNLFSNDLPPSPKLLGNYDFLKTK